MYIEIQLTCVDLRTRFDLKIKSFRSRLISNIIYLQHFDFLRKSNGRPNFPAIHAQEVGHVHSHSPPRTHTKIIPFISEIELGGFRFNHIRTWPQFSTWGNINRIRCAHRKPSARWPDIFGCLCLCSVINLQEIDFTFFLLPRIPLYLRPFRPVAESRWTQSVVFPPLRSRSHLNSITIDCVKVDLYYETRLFLRALFSSLRACNSTARRQPLQPIYQNNNTLRPLNLSTGPRRVAHAPLSFPPALPPCRGKRNAIEFGCDQRDDNRTSRFLNGFIRIFSFRLLINRKSINTHRNEWKSLSNQLSPCKRSLRALVFNLHILNKVHSTRIAGDVFPVCMFAALNSDFDGESLN